LDDRQAQEQKHNSGKIDNCDGARRKAGSSYDENVDKENSLGGGG